MKKSLFALFLILSLSMKVTYVQAQAKDREAYLRMSVSEPESDNSVEAELRSFELAPGYEANLFADESDGIANPISMNWDSAGRLWVLTTLAYPQLVPTDDPKDKLVILEDTDGDGRADKTTVFADGLEMPTGFALGHGGAYIGQGNDLLHLVDTDGDDKADERVVLLSGFGTGDTHQNINSFTWSPGGELLMSQGLHAFSRVETPWGISRMNEHGSMRLRPLRLQLQTFPRSGGSNPWGFAFGKWGEPFSKGNGPQIFDLLASLVPCENLAGRMPNAMTIGNTETKSMIIEFADSPHLPDDIQNDMLIAGYFAGVIDRFDWSADGSGHHLENKPSLLSSNHNAFRPVDIGIGPDGAIYVANWFNPIIGHYQASLRHPDRDKVHGRIWRITATGRPLASAPSLSELDAVGLVDHLKSDWRYVRCQAKRRLADLPEAEVIPAITSWVEQLAKTDENLELYLFEALGVFESHEAINSALLKRLLNSVEPRARAYATRVVGRWSDRLEGPLKLLGKSMNDENPRVRLEAIVACNEITSAEAMVVAARALEHPMDRFTNYALTLTSHALAPYWLPAVDAGELTFEHPEHLIFALRAYGGSKVVTQARKLLKDDSFDNATVASLMALLVETGTPRDLRWVLDRAEDKPLVLETFDTSFNMRGILPFGDLVTPLKRMFMSEDQKVKVNAIRLVGTWKIETLAGRVLKFFNGSSFSVEVRRAAIEAYGRLKGNGAIDVLTAAIDDSEEVIKLAALQTLCEINLSKAAAKAEEHLRSAISDAEVQNWVTPFLGHKRGTSALAAVLGSEPVPPKLATRIRSVLATAGQFNPALNQILSSVPAKDAVGIPDYSESYVQVLTSEVKQYGDVSNGAKVYTKAALSCTACHKIGQEGGVLGPELTAVGAGLPVDLLIEAVLWPERQLKEGYIMTSITTQNGKMLNGYVDSEDKRRIVIRDATSGAQETILASDVADRNDAGTLMPLGLTAGLLRADLRDLIRFLSDQTGQGEGVRLPPSPPN
ncbi:MAG: hypothetical protein CMN58_03195 [Solibacterales bacterium]|nr:hypothetical protein [Bryobacterales bacterium]